MPTNMVKETSIVSGLYTRVWGRLTSVVIVIVAMAMSFLLVHGDLRHRVYSSNYPNLGMPLVYVPLGLVLAPIVVPLPSWPFEW